MARTATASSKRKRSKARTKAKRRIVRLLPLTITMLSLLFVIKVNELYIGSQQLRDLYAARDAVAADKKEDKKEEAKAESGAHGSEEGKAAEKPAEAKAEDAKAEPAKAEEAHGKAEEGGHGAKSDDGHGGGEKPVEEEKTFGTGKTLVKDIEAMKAREAQPHYTPSELDLLQNLAKRRDDLEQRERELGIKAKVLEASEKRITDKLTEMKTLEAELSKVLAQYNEKQDTQIKSLVKIYESMKPDEAAAIFNEMEMPILLDVISKMSDRKVALVLAGMNPKRAKDVTQELADRRRKTTPTLGAGGAGAAPVARP